MMDARSVISMVKQGRYPNNWRVYWGHGGYGCMITWLLGTIAVVWFVITVWGGADLTFRVIVGISLAICVLGVLGTWGNSVANKKTILVILPESVVECYAGNLNNITQLYFPNIVRIDIAHEMDVSGDAEEISTKHKYWLDVYEKGGRYFSWHIRNCFDDAFMAKQIIAAYDHYQQNIR